MLQGTTPQCGFQKEDALWDGQHNMIASVFSLSTANIKV
jgi:hypothetical protein